MSYFDDMYERGLVDLSGMPTWEDNNAYNNTQYSNSKYNNTTLIKESIIVSLTPDKYLNNEQQYKRNKFLNGHLDTYNLEVLHDLYNENDSFALKVYCDEILIGYIQKYDNKNDINHFAFENNLLIKDLGIEFTNYKLILFRYLQKKEILTDKQIEDYANCGLTKCGFYNKYTTSYIPLRIIIPKIKKHIDKQKYKLRTLTDYKQFIEENYHLYESEIIESTEKYIQDKNLLIIMGEILDIVIDNNKVKCLNDCFFRVNEVERYRKVLYPILDKKYHIYCSKENLRMFLKSGAHNLDRIENEQGNQKYYLVEKFSKALEQENISLTKIEAEESNISFDETETEIDNKLESILSTPSSQDSKNEGKLGFWAAIKDIFIRLIIPFIIFICIVVVMNK